MYEGRDSGGGFGQLIVSRSFREYLWVSSGLYYHSNASNDERPGLGRPRVGGQSYAMAVPVALEVRLQTFLAWDAEATFNVAGDHAKYPVLSTAFKIISNRHTFALIFKRDLEDPALVAARRANIIDMILRFVRP